MAGREQAPPAMYVDTGDARLHVEVHGPQKTGPLILCAHGFPDCERSFREQIDAFVGEGYRVATPTMRGYAPSSPSATGQYHAAALARDLLAIADALSPELPVRLFGHDWGAIAAYAASALAPSRFSHLATAAVPHLRVAGPRFASPAQLRRSWYIGLFQLPLLAERELLADDLALVDRLWRDWSPGYRCPLDEMVLIKRAISAHPTAVLDYYRALKSRAYLMGEASRLVRARVRIPALYLHGRDDGCIDATLSRATEAAYDAGLEWHVIDDAGHFVHLEQPARVNPLLTRFFASKRG